ncbi:MAG: DUF3592 domain-containing protein [Candidatus Taylorbacteria bacterium]|nr:DUF3592 domain-containing protein [Candidatus Taylorbacteria bacterium]
MGFNIRYSPPSNAKQMTPKQALFIMPIVAVVGIALTIFWGIPTARNAMESKNWPSADGRITISDVSKNYDSEDDSVTYGAKITYNYTVNGITYMGGTVTFGEYSSSDPSHAGGIVSRYPVGKSVKVYYDPKDPKTSALEPGAGWSSFVGLLAGIGFSIIGVVGFLFARKKLRSQTTAPPPTTTEPPQPQSDVPLQQ